MNTKEYLYKSFLHAIGVAVYIILVVSLLSNAKYIFGEKDTVYIPVFMLLLLIISATITGSLVLGRPLLMYIDGQKKEAIMFLSATIAWLAVFLFLVCIIMVAVK